MRTPNHSGIPGNEKADKIAKSATNSPAGETKQITYQEANHWLREETKKLEHQLQEFGNSQALSTTLRDHIRKHQSRTPITAIPSHNLPVADWSLPIKSAFV